MDPLPHTAFIHISSSQVTPHPVCIYLYSASPPHSQSPSYIFHPTVVVAVATAAATARPTLPKNHHLNCHNQWRRQRHQNHPQPTKLCVCNRSHFSPLHSTLLKERFATFHSPYVMQFC